MMSSVFEISILDRLIDEQTGQELAQPYLSLQQGRLYLEQIRKNLQFLFNTRRYVYPLPQYLEQLTKSLVTYGINDFVGTELSAQEEKEQFCEMLKTTIEVFEPRLRKVEVDWDNTIEQTSGLCFKIRALVSLPAEVETIVFETFIHQKTRFVNVNSFFELAK